jgi:type 1 fimbria pilin
MKIRNLVISTAAAAILAVTTPAFAHEGHEHGDKEDLAAGETKTITGEVVDMACYVDHNATGEKHTDCARKCITSGLPVGLKADDGKTYVLIGEHKPMNTELAQYAAKKITVEGKIVSRDGINMIENAVIEK